MSLSTPLPVFDCQIELFYRYYMAGKNLYWNGQRLTASLCHYFFSHSIGLLIFKNSFICHEAEDSHSSVKLEIRLAPADSRVPNPSAKSQCTQRECSQGTTKYKVIRISLSAN